MLNLTVPVSFNNSLSTNFQKRRADFRKKKMSVIVTLTFRELSEKMRQRVADGSVSSSSLPNLESALRAFLASNCLSEDCVVGSILRVSLYRNINKHVELLKEEGRTAAYIANRKSLLGKWASLVNQLDRSDALARQSHTPFQLALQDIIKQANTNPTQLAKALHISKSVFHRWMEGTQPRQSALPALRRIESFFAMQPNALVSLAFERNYFKPSDTTTATAIPYRDRLSVFSKDHYCLKNISEQLSKEWDALLEHKTEKLPLLKRHAKGVWIATDYVAKGKTARNQHLFYKNKYVPTSSVLWTFVVSYLGWMCRDTESGGAGVSIDDVQTLAWLTHKPMIHRFLTWKIERADDKIHNGILDVVKTVKALTHPDHGYLTQMPSLNAHLPEHAQHESWKEACQDAFEWCADMKRNFTSGGIELSRDPMQPIKHILELEKPLEAIGDMTARMLACKPVTGGIEEAIWARDILLIRLMTSNPLRAKNLKLLTYKSDNTGNLYRKVDGSWNIRIDKKAFKNLKGAAGDQDYDVPVTPNVWPSIEQYLNVYRPMLPDADKVSFVFLSSVTEKQDGYIGPWVSLNRRVFFLTKRYLWDCPGIGSHGIRYIVGTAILKKNPEAWGLAAAALHDRRETVEAHYAHLRGRDKVAHVYESLIDSYARI